MNYKDRCGNVITGNEKQDRVLNGLYSKTWGRMLVKLLVTRSFSRVSGAVLNSRASRVAIKPFVNKNGICLDDYIEQKYRSYNDFFTRRIKPERREIAMDDNILISPCDGKISVHTIHEDTLFYIKNSHYSVASLLQNEKLALRYNGGYCAVIRLTVDNYHRYCYVDSGWKTENVKIPGKLHTVNPLALDYVDVYKENAREYCIINTRNFGAVVQMEVGAMVVGKIRNHQASENVIRGQEKGYFEFGGSTVVLLIKKDRVRFDADIMKNSMEHYETIVKMGEGIGEKIQR